MSLSDTELALNLRRAVNLGDEETMILAENAIAERLELSLDETELGLTEHAVRRIEAFVGEHTSAGWSYGTTETPAEELGRLRREMTEPPASDPETPEHRASLDRIAVIVREAAEHRGAVRP